MIKNILITGGAGFIGTHLAISLQRKGYSVTVVDIKPKPNNFPKEILYIKQDARNKNKMVELLTNIDICYHLAAVFGGPNFINNNPALILSENLDITLSVFEAARINKIKRIIFPSSTLAYNENLIGNLKEEDMEKSPPTKNPYGFVKLIGENLCKAYWEQYSLAFTIVRMSNVYGPGDTHDHVTPIFIKKILKGEYPLVIMGNKKASRVFVYINDIVRGLIMLIEKKKTENETFNLSDSHDITITQLAKKLWSICDKQGELEIIYEKLPGKTPLKRGVSVKKVEKVLGWKASVPLEKGLRETIQWVKAQQK